MVSTPQTQASLTEARRSNPNRPPRRRIGEILIEQGHATEEDIQQALEESKNTSIPIGTILVKHHKITKEQLGKALSEDLGFPYYSLSNSTLEKNKLLQYLPVEFIREHQVLPLGREGANLQVVMVDPLNRQAIDEITMITGMRPKVFLTTSIEFQDVFSQIFGMAASSNLLEELNTSHSISSQEEQFRQQNMVDLKESSSPLVKLVNAIIEEALERNASDIHIEPRDENLLIRFRTNGILRNMLQVPKNMESSFVTRIKVMGRMDISEHRRPLDGRFSIMHQGSEYNFRVNSLPLNESQEKVVVRILRPSKQIADFTELGMCEEDIHKIERLYKSPYGIVLMCGPTGSGKTTTLYTILNKINDDERNISTVEDPIELKIEGLNQSQVNTKAEFTFATALRALMRQDPDIIMVGEIRDIETLDASIHASLTGHLVFSTVHANTTSATVSRLVEMGAEPGLIGTSLLGIVAQRLVRKLCMGCREEYEASLAQKKAIFPTTPEKQKEPLKLHRAKGCTVCSNTGYSGRVGLYEVMVLDRKIRQMINERRLDIEIEDAAIAGGMKTLFHRGVENLLAGDTSHEELVRILGVNLGYIQ